MDVSDNTVDRVKLKNEELKDQLRSLIQQETPYRTSRTSTEESDKENVSMDSGNKNRSYSQTPRRDRDRREFERTDPQEPKVHKPRNIPPTPTPVRSRIPVLNRPIQSSPKRFTTESIRSTIPKKVPDPKSFVSSVPSVVPESIPSSTPIRPSSYSGPERTQLKKPSAADSNLLLNKISNQTQEIDQLKQYVKQLKQENNVLQQDGYSKLRVINELKHRNASELRDVKSRYEDSVSSHEHQQDQMLEQIKFLKEEVDQTRSALNRKDSEVKVVKEILKTVNNELNDYKDLKLEDNSKTSQLLIYNKLLKQLVQSNIVNKLSDDFEQLGLLIDRQIDTNLVHQFDQGTHIITEIDGSEDNTTDLIRMNRDDTTNLLIKQKAYVSLEKLVVNSIKAKKDAKTKLRVYIRFVICANRFKKAIK